MSKCIEVPNIALYEDTDSELAKYTIMQLQEENKQLKYVIEEIREYINSYDVFKEFSFPLMKREEENKKDLLQILDKAKENK